MQELYPPIVDGEIRPSHILGICSIGLAVFGTLVLLGVRLFQYSGDGPHPIIHTLAPFLTISAMGALSTVPLVQIFELEHLKSMKDRESFGVWNTILTFYVQLIWDVGIVIALTVGSSQYKTLFLKKCKILIKVLSSTNGKVAPQANIPMHDLIT